MASFSRAQMLSLSPDSTGYITAGRHDFQTATGLEHWRAFKLMADVTGTCNMMICAVVPNPLPSGQMTLRLHHTGNAATGTVEVVPKWNTAATTTDLSGLTLYSEGTTTITFASGWADDMRYTDIDLDDGTATTPVADYYIAMELEFNRPASSVLAVEFAFQPVIGWVAV